MLKGQLVFEFIIAVVLFVTIILFVLNILNTNVSSFTDDYVQYSMDSKVIAVSEALVKTRDPGFAKDWPVLNQSKIYEMNTSCITPGNYSRFLQEFDLADKPGFDTYKFSILVNRTAGGTLMDCRPLTGPARPANITSATITRYGLTDAGDEVSVDVWIW